MDLQEEVAKHSSTEEEMNTEEREERKKVLMNTPVYRRYHVGNKE